MEAVAIKNLTTYNFQQLSQLKSNKVRGGTCANWEGFTCNYPLDFIKPKPIDKPCVEIPWSGVPYDLIPGVKYCPIDPFYIRYTIPEMPV